MTARDLTDILLSAEFKHDLQDLSCYLASIMQERPIVYLIAKQLWRRGLMFELEEKRCDLSVNGKRIEVKFNYNRCEEALTRELATIGDDLIAAFGPERSIPINNFGVAERIYRDICVKNPDLFAWIVCSRDLSRIPASDLKRVCYSRQQCKYNTVRPYNPDGSSLTVIDAFLNKLKKQRPFELVTLDIETTGSFPSTYHFRICEFPDSAKR